MKILKRGTPPSEVVYDVTCNNCHSEIQFERKEATFGQDQREGDSWLEIKCPVCDAKIFKYI